MPTEETGSVNAELVKGGVEIIKTAYADGLSPAVSEIGKALGTVGKTVNMALSPLAALVWSYEKVQDWFEDKVTEKLASRGVPQERVITPDPQVAIPAIEALRYSSFKDQFASLLATAMDSATAAQAHPAFVEVLKQMTPDEARIMAFIPTQGGCVPIMDFGFRREDGAGSILFRNLSTLAEDAACETQVRAETAIDNLCRLGLLEIPTMRKLLHENRYDRIRALAAARQAKNSDPSSKFEGDPKILAMTTFGRAFWEVCIRTQPPEWEMAGQMSVPIFPRTVVTWS